MSCGQSGRCATCRSWAIAPQAVGRNVGTWDVHRQSGAFLRRNKMSRSELAARFHRRSRTDYNEECAAPHLGCVRAWPCSYISDSGIRRHLAGLAAVEFPPNLRSPPIPAIALQVARRWQTIPSSQSEPFPRSQIRPRGLQMPGHGNTIRAVLTDPN